MSSHMTDGKQQSVTRLRDFCQDICTNIVRISTKLAHFYFLRQHLPATCNHLINLKIHPCNLDERKKLRNLV